MKLSEVAKELGYKAAELIVLAKDVGIAIENVRAEVDARKKAAICAKVPQRTKLAGHLLELFTKVKADLAAQEAVREATKVAEPKTKKTVRRKAGEKTEEKPAPAEPAAEPAPHPPTRVETPTEVIPAKVEAAAPKSPPLAAAVPEAAPAKAEAPAKPVSKKPQVVAEFRLGESGIPLAKERSKLLPPKPHTHVPIPEEAKKPLIDVDKVIGAEKEVHALRPQEVDVTDKVTQEEKEKRHVKPVAKTPASGPTTILRGRKPKVPPPALRPTVAPPRPRPVVTPIEERKLEITCPIKIKDFCELTGIKANMVIRKLLEQGVIATINNVMDETLVGMMTLEFKRDITIKKEQKLEETVVMKSQEKDDPKDLVARAPVVTFLGHVDHGKTSLLDRIRNTNVAAGESGGITQHIGAYKVAAKDGKSVVFLDTPGHEAFTAMRARGAHVTDVAVLVVDAADGVMPQTEEAINHAKAANVKIVVALNKIDKPQANPNKVKGQLAGLGLQPEDWGGDVVCVEVSALTGQNVESLLEMLSLEAELLDLKANPKREATGAVLEARKTEDRGVVATILVQNGTLRRGDTILAGKATGRVRAMIDHTGQTINEAPPSTPVELLGFTDVPDAGDKFMVVTDATQAKEIAEERQKKAREAQLMERQHVTLENLFSRIETDKLKEVRVVIKVDVKGSLEVLKDSLQNLSTDEVKLRVLHATVGAINESDVILADASDAIIIGFHVDVEGRAAELAKEKGVDIKLYTIIYQAVEEMKAALEGLLEPEEVEVKSGHATVKEIFRISRVGVIAGCLVSDGKVERTSQVRLIRDGKVVHTGRVETLKRFKDDVREVVEGYECGIKLAGHDDIRPSDVIEAFSIQKVARKLEKRRP